MFSSRTNWPRHLNPLSSLADEFRRAGKKFSDLTISNPTACGIDYPVEEITSALAQPQSLHYEPDPKGMLSAREAVSSYYWGKGLEINPANIILTASTSEAYSMVFKLLCEPGDEVLVPVPSYPLFEFLAQLNDVVIRPYHLRYDGEWHIDMSSVEQSLSARTKAIVVVSPHNPTGMFLKKPELAALSTACIQYGLALVVDEVFTDYTFGDDGSNIVSTANNSDVLTFTLNGISKLAGLPQMKLGWMVVSGSTDQREEALSRLEIVADAYLSVNTPVQVALPKLFEIGAGIRSSIRDRTSANMGVLQQIISSDSKCSALHSEGGWYAILRVPQTRTGEEWALALLHDAGIFVHPGYFFEFQQDNVLVLSLLTPTGEFRDATAKLLDYVQAHS